MSGQLKVILRAMETTIRQRSQDAPPGTRFGVVAFVPRIGGYLKSHVHFHVLLTDDVFSARDDGDTVSHQVLDLGDVDCRAVQEKMRKRGYRW